MEPVRAAGGVLWRPADGTVEVALVHRARYDDWSLPKGKLDHGETFAEAALREVEEETGHRGELGPELGDVRYVHRGRDKVVRYWAMRARDGAFLPGAEVDELRWLAAERAAAQLTYDRDRDVLARFLDSDAFADAVRAGGK